MNRSVKMMATCVGLVVAAAAYLPGCSGGSSGSPGALGVARLGQAAVTNTNTRAPLTFSIPSPCTGETINFTGTEHTVTHTTTDSGGGTHTDITVNFQGLSGVGQVSGRQYNATSNLNTSINCGTGSACESTENLIVTITSQGNADNFISHSVIHFTLNANGELTSEVAHVNGECGG